MATPDLTSVLAAALFVMAIVVAVIVVRAIGRR